MIVKTLLKGAKTDEEYRNKLKSRCKADILLCFAGAAAIIAALFAMMRMETMHAGFVCGLFSGTGAVIIVMGIKEYIKAKKLLRDEKRLRAERLKESDERNSLIMQKTMYLTGYIMLGLCYVTMLISVFFNMMVFWCIWAVTILYCLLLAVIKKYYEKNL
ncbi:hypothetical protein DWX43_22975 [Clostridium sp. AF19-22AC]|jgi:Ca2+/Na+ antiporter|uniref:Uncharacterized protein n=1 Tax=Faecalicatena orotica TaxID=1544 RepID=A0A2Y9BF13_9FIRM|nr:MULTISPECIES: hypothetical protein [Clostridia]PWJ29709.1 hypothetical protein A8806_1059 [Faecalicatena orotica]RHR21879.1 hypothetical protein DWX43_22975 [Clostridium sp. AF19-22AC]SSA55432.1 hypothetical protein SAMN05216536_1059 [Faecalicatena orotica]